MDRVTVGYFDTDQVRSAPINSNLDLVSPRCHGKMFRLPIRNHPNFSAIYENPVLAKHGNMISSSR
jgi:hypothetical protein